MATDSSGVGPIQAPSVPVTPLFRCFRMAVYPPRLALALLFLFLVCMGGLLLDELWGTRVLPEEFEAYRTAADDASFDRWQRKTRAKRLDRLSELLATPGIVSDASKVKEADNPWAFARKKVRSRFADENAPIDKDASKADRRNALKQIRRRKQQYLSKIAEMEKRYPIFRKAAEMEMEAFSALVQAIVGLRPGFAQVTPAATPKSDTAVGAARIMAVTLPGWLWHSHRWFLLTFVVVALLFWSFVGAVLSRLAVVDAARGEAPSATEAVRFVWQRWGTYVAAPATPLLVTGFLALLLAAGGGLLMNWPGADILGALLFGLFLVGGFVMALLLIGWVGGVHMMYPAVSADGSDALDATSRSFHYLFGRPWRYLAYSLVSLVYGAVGYIFVGLVVFFTLALTHWAVGTWVVTETAEGTNRLQALFPRPVFGELIYVPNWGELDRPGQVAALFVMVWVHLVIGALGAFAVSFYVHAYSTIYLLLRRVADGTDVAEIVEPTRTDEMHSAPAEKVEAADQPA